MRIPYTKAHGLQNDFLLTPVSAVPEGDPAEIAKAICHRYTGVGADGWLIVAPGDDECTAEIRLINSDGSHSEMSGNGTRCAAAYAMPGGSPGDEIAIRTGAGLKRLRLVEQRGLCWRFEMNMGRAYYSEDEVRASLPASGLLLDVTILNVGNPQCAVFVENFDLDWRKLGAEIEWHTRFPKRTNVSFVRVADRHTLDIRIWERGAGETMSSGTGSTGAAFAAVLRGLVESPICVRTPAGPLTLRLEGGEMFLTGDAEMVAEGEFYWKEGRHE